MKNYLLHRLTLLLTVAMACMSVAASDIETKTINSQADWENFVKNYDSETEVNVILNCDVNINTKGVLIKKFIGTLDGQGHAFVINYKDNKSGDQNASVYDENWDEDSAPFANASGTIKNLRLTGTVAIRYGFAAYRWNNPLIQILHNEVVFENCHSDVAFVNTGTMAAGWNTCHIGGFIGSMNYGKATFNNCSFTGSFTYTDPDGGHDYNDTGSFVGYCADGTIKLTNCYSSFTYDDRGKIVSFGHFLGHNVGSEHTEMTNCYEYCENENGEAKSINSDDNATDLALYGGAEFIRNGGLTMALNAGSNGTNPWAQTVGIDAVPLPKATYPKSETLVNLVGNGYFNNNSTNWTSDTNTDTIVKDKNGNYFWRTSYAEGRLAQTIDLAKYYTEDELASSSYKAILVCDWGHQYGFTVLKARYTFLDANGTQLGLCDLISENACSDEHNALTWKSAGRTISLPAGTRKVEISLAGKDYKNWDGSFGPAFDNVSIALVKNGSVPTAINTATTNAPRPAAHKGIFTLDGQRLERIAHPGLYIIDGRKVLVK